MKKTFKPIKFPKLRRNKYGNKKVINSGYKMDSKKESLYYSQLKLAQENGEISLLTVKPKYYFPINGENLKYVDSNRDMYYEADFRYYDLKLKKLFVVDVKSAFTKKLQVYRIKKALMRAIHNITITEV